MEKILSQDQFPFSLKREKGGGNSRVLGERKRRGEEGRMSRGLPAGGTASIF
ncbi:MAG: hypothetical protein HOC74_27340 [Gemmatimonadetes bacterium]|jgi:hypothetical protein|nr:hypothetical protein [Gemmatimonadota bacterium]